MTGVRIDQIDLCPPLAEASQEAKRRLAEASREVHFQAGETIVPIIDPPQRIVILLEGRAKLVGITESGIERILYVYQPCEIIGSRIILQNSQESPFEVIAMEPILALAISKEAFMRIAQFHPEVMVAVSRVLLKRLERLSTWMLAAMSADVPIRLAKLLLDFAADASENEGEFVPLTYSLTHEVMAQAIGASRPHTSAQLRDLEEAGAVRRLRPRGLLVCPARLRDMLEMAGFGEKDLAG